METERSPDLCFNFGSYQPKELTAEKTFQSSQLQILTYSFRDQNLTFQGPDPNKALSSWF